MNDVSHQKGEQRIGVARSQSMRPVRYQLRTRQLDDFAFAVCVRAEAIEVGRFLHGLALHAAIFAAFASRTTAGWMLAFPLFCCHKSSYLQKFSRLVI